MHKRELRAMHDLRNAAKRVAEALNRHPREVYQNGALSNGADKRHPSVPGGWIAYGDTAALLLDAVEAAIAMAREVDAIEPREDA